MLMAYSWPFLVANGGTEAQPTGVVWFVSDLNFAPTANIIAESALTGMLFFGDGVQASVGFLQYTVVDLVTGAVTTEDLSDMFFGTTAIFAANNVSSVTIAANGLADPGEAVFVQAMVRIDSQ